VIDVVGQQEKNGALRAGDKLPSLRKLSRQFEISIPTVKHAYIELERQGTISARPQSGYYLKAKQARTLKPMRAKWVCCEPLKYHAEASLNKSMKLCIYLIPLR
jgi:DNA-binding transcriptional regulator YhcF (GntR family)